MSSVLILGRFRVWCETEISLPLSCLLWTKASVSGPSGSVARLLHTVHVFFLIFISLWLFLSSSSPSLSSAAGALIHHTMFPFHSNYCSSKLMVWFFSRRHYSFQCKQWLEPLIYLHIHIYLYKLSVMNTFLWLNALSTLLSDLVCALIFLYLLKFSASQLEIF